MTTPKSEDGMAFPGIHAGRVILVLERLNNVLAEFDGRADTMTEHDVGTAIRAIRDNDDQTKPPMEWLAEAMAFGFCENYRGRDGGWGTYFGPEMSGVTQDGERQDWPSLKAVTQEILSVVAQRIVHGPVQHLDLPSVPAVATTLSIAEGSAIIPACS